MSLGEKAKAITDKISFATLATVSNDGQPWNSPVAAIHDDDLTYYWASWTENQHSKNSRANGKVFIVVYDSTVTNPDDAVGVYIRAIASEVTDLEEINAIIAKVPIGNLNKETAENFLGDYPRRWYKAIPQQIWLNTDGDVRGNFVDMREELR